MGRTEVEREVGRKPFRVTAVELESERLQSVVAAGDDASRYRAIESVGRIVRNIKNADRASVAQRIAAEPIVAEDRDCKADLRRRGRRACQTCGEENRTKRS